MIPLVETLEISLWLKFLVDATMKSFVIFAVAGLFGLILRRHSAAVRGLVWSLAILGCLIVPFFSLTLPQWEVGVLPATPDEFEVDRLANNKQAARSPVPIASRPLPATTVSSTQAIPTPIQLEPAISESSALESNISGAGFASLHWTEWIAVCWAVGALFLIARLIVGIGAIWHLSARSSQFKGSIPHIRPGWKRTVSVRRSDAVTVPMVWGLFRPVILLPADADGWELERQRAVLLHELAHIYRWDWLTQTIAQMACAVYWFNPLVWFAARRMRTEVERACDDHVLNAGYQSTDYAQHLLDIVRNVKALRSSSRAAVTMARSSKIEGRLRTVLAENLNRRPVTKIAVAIGLLTLICFAVLMGVMRLTETAGPNDDPASLNEAYERKEQIYGVMVNGTRWRIHDLLRAELILGKPAPDFSHTSLHGSPVSLSVLRGKVVVLYYWSIEYDEADISQFKRLHKTHGENPDLVLISVCVQSRAAERKAEVKRFVETHAMPGIHLLLESKMVPYPFAVKGWPYYVVIDKAGIVRESDRGYALSGRALRDLEVEQLVTALLAEGIDISGERIIPRISQIRSEFYISQGQKEKATAEYEKLLAFLYQKQVQTGEAAALINRAYDRMVEARHFSGPGADLSSYRAGLGQFASDYEGELGQIFSQQFDREKMIESHRQVSKHQTHRKQSLEKLAQQPLTPDQQHLLIQLLKNNVSLDQVLSSEPYLGYLKTEYGQAYKDFAAYVASMPTSKQKIAIRSALKSTLSPITDVSTLPAKTKAEQLQICVNAYFEARKWQLTKEGTRPIITEINDMEMFQKMDEFSTFFGTYFIPPMVEMYRDTLLGIDNSWTDSHTYGLYQNESDMHVMGEVVYFMADDDTEVFQNAFRERLEEYGSQEGLLRCAIGFPDEFALMRSFFEDTVALEKWILEPPSPSKEKWILLRPPPPEKEAEKGQ